MVIRIVIVLLNCNLASGVSISHFCFRSDGHLFIDFKKAYDSVRREVLYNILIEFGIPNKLVRYSVV